VPQLAQGFKDAFALVSWLRGVKETFEEAAPAAAA
jgi:hypothetical protein